MQLTEQQQAILNGSQGEVMAKVMKTLVKYGEAFGAEKMVPVTSKYNHLVTSFGLKALGPVYELMNQLIGTGALSQQKFSVDPRPLDKNVLVKLQEMKTIQGIYMPQSNKNYYEVINVGKNVDEVKVGNIVIINKNNAVEVNDHNQAYFLISEIDILGIVEE